MEDKQKTLEDLQIENMLLKETISVQHDTIHRLLNTYVLKHKPESKPKNQKR